MTPAQREIVAEVAERHGLTVDRILTKCPRRHFSWARQEAAYRLREAGRWSFLNIAAVLNQNHTTVVYSVDAYADRAGLPRLKTLTEELHHGL
jgi:chromosomal replication initiation ATPase DnaA